LTQRDVQFEAPTWNQIYKLLLKQADKIRDCGFKPDFIVGVCRGGWVPARLLSDFLDNSNLASLRVECYVSVGKSKSAPELTQCLSADVAGKRVLVVDEVADSGKSLNLAVAHVVERGACEVKTATLYYKSKSIFKPDFYEVETTCWVVFPWEINETAKSIYQTHKSKPARVETELAKLADAGVSRRLLNRFLKEFSEVNP
jgi:uncharacterized protein